MSESPLVITNDDLYLYAKGDWLRSWEKMGAHKDTVDGVEGFNFAVWCPDVKSVTVIGTFNDWNVEAAPLVESKTGGIWTGFVPGVQEGDLYKYCITTADGEVLYKADPYAFWAECPPGTASRVKDIDDYKWHDGLWMGRRARTDHMKRPLNIYEVHLGSWKRHDDGLDGLGYGEGGGSYLTYEELSEELVSYVQDMGYTHIELMPVMEHPFDGSWGYQTTGYYAPTSRYGKPEDFMKFIDACHKASIGVILDWVPGGFCRDAQGLVHFNGKKLYEHEEHANWGTYKFDFSRGEVQSFLISNALFWLEKYHADGIRVDGVTSMLYLNFGVDDPSQKKFNEKGGEENLVAVDFVKRCNSLVGQYHPDVMMIAEESTAWPLVTYPPKDGGLGFHYKWDMGWMNDTLHYCQTDFPWRPGNHKLLTFSMMYAFNENFILPLSHDEVVHGKSSLIGRMPGDWWRQFAGLRLLAFYQMMHPGAKLNFMGNEIGQFIEWRYYEGIEFFLSEQYETHGHEQAFIKALNHFYKDQKGLWQDAYSWKGFEWINADNADQSMISFVRKGDRPVDDLVIVINFDPRVHEEYRIGVTREGNYAEIFNTDATEFGGSGVLNEGKLSSEAVPYDGQENSLVLRIPPLAGVVLKRTGKSSNAPKATRKKAAPKTAEKAEAPAKKAAPKKTAKKAAAAAEAPVVETVEEAPAKKKAPAKKAAPKKAAKAEAPVIEGTEAPAKKTTKKAAAKETEAPAKKPAAKKTAKKSK
jgi:1,4-alpha-glucan branching enzyme